ncbi:hypothetical protein AMTR_s00004p00268780 [Amborella trichopoda]|uniref:Uncharacterized protein n=1 Tax=Amborella trichopoda TaxID=13333 RepID=W1NF47_AMBTC|nr:hypothetical protein AMTR_s00004p00268780 [Amborella trichopoda]
MVEVVAKEGNGEGGGCRWWLQQKVAEVGAKDGGTRRRKLMRGGRLRWWMSDDWPGRWQRDQGRGCVNSRRLEREQWLVWCSPLELERNKGQQGCCKVAGVVAGLPQVVEEKMGDSDRGGDDRDEGVAGGGD